jgi:hypothetical protein
MPIPVGISGSRGAAVLGLSPFRTPVSVWLEIMGPEFCAAHNFEFPVFEGNAATRFGQAFEAAILALTEKKYGLPITDRQAFYEDENITCHLDGIMGDAIIEAKTTTDYIFSYEWGEEGSGRIPISYQIQINHNAYLANKSRAIVPVLIFPRRQSVMEEEGITPENIDVESWASVLNEMGYLKYYEIAAHKELQTLMLAHYREWWERHVIGRTAPEPRTYDDIKALCREPVGTIIATEEIERLIAERDQINSEIGDGGSLRKRSDQIRVSVLDWMRGADSTLDDDSEKKWVLRGRDGKKLAQYGADKNGRFIFR